MNFSEEKETKMKKKRYIYKYIISALIFLGIVACSFPFFVSHLMCRRSLCVCIGCIARKRERKMKIKCKKKKCQKKDGINLEKERKKEEEKESEE